MNFTLEIEIKAAPELLETLKMLAGAVSAKPAEAPKPSSNGKAKVEPAKAVSSEPVKAEEKPEAKAPEAKAEAKVDQPDISIEALRKIVGDKAKAGHKETIKKILGDLGASNVTSLDKAKYPDFKAKVEAL